MHYGELKKCDIANGDGRAGDAVRIRLHQPLPGLLPAPDVGFSTTAKQFTGETKAEIFAELDKPYRQRPDGAGRRALRAAEPAGAAAPAAARSGRSIPHKTIWCFTGFRLDDELLADGSYPRCEVTDALLACIDVLVDGRFVRELKDISLQFRGSRNQRVIDMNKTRETGTITIWDQLRR